MKKVLLVLSCAGILLHADLQAASSSSSSLKDDTKAAFQKVSSGDYKGMSSLIKKYTDASSIQAMLSAKDSKGQTLLHMAANNADTQIALQMAVRIVNQAASANLHLQKKIIAIKDKQNKTPLDYATSRNNGQLVALFNNLTGSTQSSTSTSTEALTTGTTSTGTTSQSSTSTSTSTSTQASTSLQADIATAFQEISKNNYMGMSKLVKKYTDAASIQTMLTTLQNGQTLLHAAASADISTAGMMVARIAGQASVVSPQFQLQVINAKDSQGKTASDYAASKGNTDLVNLFTQMSASLSSTIAAQ